MMIVAEQAADIASDAADWEGIAYGYGDAVLRARAALTPAMSASNYDEPSSPPSDTMGAVEE